MASGEENAATVRRGYDLFIGGNMTELAGIFADDVIWHAGGRSALAGEKRGRDAAFAYFAQLAEAAGGTYRPEIHDVVGNGDHVVGVHTATGQRNDKNLNLHELLLFHLRDGKIVEAWEHFEDSQTWDDFFA